MDRKRLILIGFLLVLCFVLFNVLQRMGARNNAPVPQQQPQQPVVEQVKYSDVLVASGDINRGSRLNETNFSWKPWPAEAVSPNHITRDNRPQAMEEFAAGFAKTDFYADDPIVAQKIHLSGEKSLMASIIRPGMRAVTTRISVDTAAGGFIQPGDNVDIILTSSVPGFQGSAKRYVSETIFENVKVLAIDQSFSHDGSGGATIIGSTATFEMTQGDSELLNQSVAQGDISLTLRPMGRGSAAGRSHARVNRGSNEVSTLTIYRDGQPTQVAIKGQ